MLADQKASRSGGERRQAIRLLDEALAVALGLHI
jgi:hypothetical protein